MSTESSAILSMEERPSHSLVDQHKKTKNANSGDDSCMPKETSANSSFEDKVARFIQNGELDMIDGKILCHNSTLFTSSVSILRGVCNVCCPCLYESDCIQNVAMSSVKYARMFCAQQWLDYKCCRICLYTFRSCQHCICNMFPSIFPI